MTRIPLLTYLLILNAFATETASALNQRFLHRTFDVYRSKRIRNQPRHPPSLSDRATNNNLPHLSTQSQSRISFRIHSNAVSSEDTKRDKNADSKSTGRKEDGQDEIVTSQIVSDIANAVSTSTSTTAKATPTSSGGSSSSSRTTLLGISVTYLAVSSALAKFEFLGPYTDELLARDVGASLVTTVLALIFVKFITTLAKNGTLEARDSRKIIHMCSAPLFMITWPLFTANPGARVFAAFVPALQCCRLWLAGTKKSGSDGTELAGAISRSGDAAEALKGPFIYVVILFTAIMLFFCDNLTGVVALSTMAAGDGLADIFGRRFGKNNKWPFSKSKSIAGSAAFVAAASLCSFGLSAWLIHTGTISTGMAVGWEMAQRIFFISVASAAVELLPVGDDNWSVPIAAAVLSSLLLY